MEKESFLKNKKVISAFAIAALVFGIGFVNKTMTGNVVSTTQYPSTQNILPLIGIGLVICSAILSAYIIFKR